MAIIIKQDKKFRPLVSPIRNQNLPIYNWHSFKHSFSKELVDCLIKEFNLKNNNWVLDPFCGGGTTLLACKQAGINSIGYDILPFSVFLSNTKVKKYNEIELTQELKKFRKNEGPFNIKFKLPDIPIIKKAFNEDIKVELLSLKHIISSIKRRNVRNFYNLALLSILERVSNTIKGGGFLRLIKRKIKAEDVKHIFLNKVTDMISDVIKNNNINTNESVETKAYLGDARNLTTKRKFDAVITSPPYPNRHDYTRIYSLEMIFDSVTSNEELKKIRYNTLRSHVEAKRKYTPKDYCKPKILDNIITRISKNGTNNPQVIPMLEGYFEDMFMVLTQTCKVLKEKSKLGLVVSNVRYSGVNVPVDKILSEIGQQAGLTIRHIVIGRYRGNSSQQMKEYKRRPSRESIIVWEK